MEQLSFVFPQPVTPSHYEVQAASIPIPLQIFNRVLELAWKERRRQARIAELAYFQAVADENQLVFDFLDLGLTRRARSRVFTLLFGTPGS